MSMVKAIVKGGAIIPQAPLPVDWADGTELDVEKSLDVNRVQDVDAWMDELEAHARQGDPADDLRLEEALRDIHEGEKEMTRRRLGIKP